MNTSDKQPKKPEQLLPLVWDKKQDRGRPIGKKELLKTLKMYGNGNGNTTD